jgi:RNA polymerase sigma factor (sigma-70 family)
LKSSMESGRNCPPDVRRLLTQASPPPENELEGDAASKALTNEQRKFAAENHSLIHAYLRKRGLERNDYYDIAVFGYLHAVKQYLTEPRMRRYRFSTVAWRAMRQSIAAFRRAEMRRKKAERSYLETARPSPPDPFEALEAKLLLQDLAAVSTREQYALAAIRLQGCSIAETARIQGMSEKRVRGLLKELFRVYLCLYF